MERSFVESDECEEVRITEYTTFSYNYELIIFYAAHAQFYPEDLGFHHVT